MAFLSNLASQWFAIPAALAVFAWSAYPASRFDTWNGDEEARARVQTVGAGWLEDPAGGGTVLGGPLVATLSVAGLAGCSWR